MRQFTKIKFTQLPCSEKVVTLSWSSAKQSQGHLESLPATASPASANAQKKAFPKQMKEQNSSFGHTAKWERPYELLSQAGRGGKHSTGHELTVLQGWRGGKEGGKDFVLPRKQQMPAKVKPKRAGALQLKTQLFCTSIQKSSCAFRVKELC